jgi:hypothetical protein
MDAAPDQAQGREESKMTKRSGRGRSRASGRKRSQLEHADVIHGRDFAGSNIAATEREQTREREQAASGIVVDEIGELTDAEAESLDVRRAERDEG